MTPAGASRVAGAISTSVRPPATSTPPAITAIRARVTPSCASFQCVAPSPPQLTELHPASIAFCRSDSAFA
jgi:hypothetical protein